MSVGGAKDNIYTYDRAEADGGPYVPSVVDLGGDEYEDDKENPPQVEAEPSGGQFNEIARNVAGVNRVIAKCVLEIEWDGTTNANAYSVLNCDAMGTDAVITAASFTLTRQATGAILVAWTSGALPAVNRKPHVHVVDDFGKGYGSVQSATSIAVRLRDLTNTAADLNFDIEIRTA